MPNPPFLQAGPPRVYNHLPRGASVRASPFILSLLLGGVLSPLPARASLDFTGYVTYGAGPATTAVLAADLNGDGDADALALSGPDPYLSGDNTLYTYVSCGYRVLCLLESHLLSDADPRGLAAGDFNDDGHLDVAVAGASGVSVLWGSASGALGGPTLLSASIPLYAAVAADFDGDGRTDLAASGGSSPIHIYMQGGGGLGAAVTVALTLAGSTGLDAGDLDADGDVDLAVVNPSYPGGKDVQIIKRVPAGFEAGAGYDVASGVDARGIAVGDVSGDGRADVVVSYGTNSPYAYLGIFKQNVSGTLDSPVSFSTYNTPSAVALADLDSDGDQDAGTLHNGWQAFSAHEQTGGALGGATTFPVPYASAYTPEALALADLDGDGVADALLADPSMGLVILWNQSVDDADGDGFSVEEGDCDDGSDLTHPGAAEQCDEEDNNCDGALPAIEEDGDHDGSTGCDGDCDDTDASFHPGADEGCDALDQDCDGSPGPLELDADGDGYAECQGDCDDSDPSIQPEDFDGDGSSVCGGDCDDENPSVNPNAAEACDGIDNDCDGMTDESVDGDGDGFSLCDGDCADLDPDIHPGEAEHCSDGRDNDCDGFVDLTLSWFTAGVVVVVEEGGELSLGGEADVDDCGGEIAWRVQWFSSHPGVLGEDTCTGWEGLEPLCVPTDDVEDGTLLLRFETAGGEVREESIGFTITNVPPGIAASPPDSGRAGEVYTFSAAATDPGDDDLRFSLSGDLPEGMWIHPDGLVSFIPVSEDAGIWPIELRVEDGDGGEDSLYFSLTLTAEIEGDDDVEGDDDDASGDDDSSPGSDDDGAPESSCGGCSQGDSSPLPGWMAVACLGMTCLRRRRGWPRS